MQQLSQFPASTHLSLLPPGVPHSAALATLSGMLATHAGEETAGLFAAVQETREGFAFLAPMGRVARFDQLDAEGRARLRAEIGRLASLLRRTADVAARADPAAHGGLPELVSGALDVPSFEHVFAQGGRPVLAGWGLAPGNLPQGAGLLRPLDDGKPASHRAQAPLLALALGTLGLALLAGLGVVATPLLFNPAERLCRIEEGDLGSLLRLEQEREREQALRAEIARVSGEVALRQTQCPLREVVLPAPREPQPREPPREAPPRELPPPPPPPPERPPPQRPANATPCNQETNSGGQGVTVTRHYLGPQRGRVSLKYDARMEPDRFEVLHRGRQLGSSDGFQSGTGAFSFDWNPPANGTAEDYVVEVRVTGRPGSATTVWRYGLDCPGR